MVSLGTFTASAQTAQTDEDTSNRQSEIAWESLQAAKDDIGGSAKRGNSERALAAKNRADQAKVFYEDFPNDARVGQARNMEIYALIETIELGNDGVVQRLQDAVAKLRASAGASRSEKAEGVAADKFTRAYRSASSFEERLVSLAVAASQFNLEFPDAYQGYQTLLVAAQGGEDALAAEIVAELLDSEAPDGIKSQALALVPILSLLDLSLYEIESLKETLSDYRAQPVLIYSWSGDDERSIAFGRMVQARRFAAIAINLDKGFDEARRIQHEEGLGGIHFYQDFKETKPLIAALEIQQPLQVYLADDSHTIVEVRAVIHLEEKLARWGFETTPLVQP